MSSKTNPPFQVIIPTGNQALLAAGSRPSALAVGQIGVFNKHSGLSVDAATPIGDKRDIYLAVGVDPLAVGSLQDIVTSAGEEIQAEALKAYNLRGYMDELPKIVQIGGYAAKCERSYAFKVEFRNNAIYKINGYNQFTKTYSFVTGCCADECVDCADGNCNELTFGLIAIVNVDPDKLITASAYLSVVNALVATAPTADGNTVVTIGTETFTVAVLDADTVAQTATKIVTAINLVTASKYFAVDGITGNFKIYAKSSVPGGMPTASALGSGVTLTSVVTSEAVLADSTLLTVNGLCAGIRITGNPEGIRNYCNINLKYDNPRGTDLIVSLVEGFNCNGTVSTVQELQYSEGKGYNIRQLEYEAGGWNGKPGPYRTSTITGTAREGFQFYASTAVNYTMLSLQYYNKSASGFLDYQNLLETIVAIPCADTTTLTGLIAVLDPIFSNFQVLANDAALLDCTNAKTETLAATTDGIETHSF